MARVITDDRLLKAELNRKLRKTMFWLESKLKTAVPKDTGEHAGSIASRVDGLTGVIYSDKWQAVVSEFGRKPGTFPPLDALVGWVIRKFGLQGLKTAGYASQPLETKRAIFNVARSIANRGLPSRRGQKGRYSRTIKKNERGMNDIFINA